MRSLELKRAILRLFRGKEFYGYEIHKQLSASGYNIELTRLYRVLNEMLNEGLLVAQWKKSPKGPKRRMYRVGKHGQAELDQILKDAIDVVHEFYSEYLRTIAPHVLSDLVQFMTNGLKDDAVFVYVVSESTVMHKYLLKSLRQRVPKSRIYFVKPEQMSFEEELNNLSVLNGSLQTIPLKQDFADLLIAPNLSSVQHLEAAVQEWTRILKSQGRLILGVPSALVHKYKDPLSIGQYMEKIEHQSTSNTGQFDKELLEEMLSRQFTKIEHKHVVHLTVYSATEKHSL